MRKDSVIIADSKAKPEKPEHCDAQLVALPFTATAKRIRHYFNEKYGRGWSDMCSNELRYFRF